MKEKGGFAYDEETGKFKVDPAKMKEAVRVLARKLLILEGDGNYENAAKFVERYGRMDDLITKTIDKLQDIPVDIKPIFKHEKTEKKKKRGQAPFFEKRDSPEKGEKGACPLFQIKGTFIHTAANRPDRRVRL